MLIVLNQSPALFTLSQKAYARLIELGIPVRPANAWRGDGDGPVVIYDEAVDGVLVSDNPDDAEKSAGGWIHSDYRYSTEDFMFGENRTHPLLVQVVQELGQDASADGARLRIFDIPDTVAPIITNDGAGWEVAAWL